jgi:mRNA interferase RelE/StbE
MSYRVRIKRSAEKEMRSLPNAARRRMHQTITRLSNQPRPDGVVKLATVDGWRIRVGDYRIVYQIDDRLREVTVVLVKHRREVYRYPV